MPNQPSIKTIFTRKIVLISLVSLSLLSLVWIRDEYTSFMEESQQIRTSHVEQQKALIKNEVKNVVSYINYMQGRTLARLEDNIRENVEIATSIASSIYEQNKTSHSAAEIQTMIKDALRPIRFNHGRGYYFAFNLDGIEELFADRPELEGTNMLGLQGGAGEFVVRDMIELVKKQGQGLYRYTWSKPGKQGNNHPKIAYVKLFAPYNWVIGTGEYLADVKEEIQQEVLKRIVSMRFGDEGYFFGSSYDGQPLFSNGKITQGGQSLQDLTDPNGVKIIQEQQRIIKNQGGGFVNYSWNKLNAAAPSPKIAYVQGIPEWEWIVGTGVYLDTVEKTIAENERAHKAALRAKLFKSAVILLIIFIIVLAWARNISQQLHAGISLFSGFFQEAATRAAIIDPDKLYFAEFREIANFANKMLIERKKIEENLQHSQKSIQESHKRLLTVLDSLEAIVYVADFDTYEILYANQYFKNHFGEVTGKICWSVIQEGQSGPCQFCTNDKLLTPEGEPSGTCAWEFQNTINGHWYYIHDRAIQWVDGRYVRMEIATDITEKKTAEGEKENLQRRLHQAQKMEAIGTLAGGIAHDFNNILGSILGYAELAKDDAPPESQIEGDLNQVIKAGHRAKELVKQILAFSRQAKVERIPIQLQPLLKEALKMLRASMPATIDIEHNIDPHCGPVLADPTQVHQILMNLCTNAYHAMEAAGGTLAVSLEPVLIDVNDSRKDMYSLAPGTYVQLTVSDTGCGIDADIIDRIFEPYFTTKSADKGTGMGLAIAHGIIREYGGAIQVESRPGEGTTFVIFLPVIAQEILPTAVDEEPIPHGRERILFIDDEQMLAEMGKDMLERLGYQVTTKQSSFEALETFRKDPGQFDLVITDHTMPGLTGSELARRMLQIRRDIPIILCTGYTNLINEESAKALGIKAFVLKPITRSLIANLIRQVLEEK